MRETETTHRNAYIDSFCNDRPSYRRGYHDAKLDIQDKIDSLEADNERLRDLLAKSIRREEIIEAENKTLRSAMEKINTAVWDRVGNGYPMFHHSDKAFKKILDELERIFENEAPKGEK